MASKKVSLLMGYLQSFVSYAIVLVPENIHTSAKDGYLACTLLFLGFPV